MGMTPNSISAKAQELSIPTKAIASIPKRMLLNLFIDFSKKEIRDEGAIYINDPRNLPT